MTDSNSTPFVEYEKFMREFCCSPRFVSTLRVYPNIDWMTVQTELWKLQGFVNRAIVGKTWKKARRRAERLDSLAVMEGTSAAANNHCHIVWNSKKDHCEAQLFQAIEKFCRGSRVFFEPWIEVADSQRIPGMIKYMIKEGDFCELDLSNPQFADRLYWS